jgi:hypothetical protein
LEEEAKGTAVLAPGQFLWVFTSAARSSNWSLPAGTNGAVLVKADKWQVRVVYDATIVFLLRVMIVDKRVNDILVGRVKSAPTLAIKLDAAVKPQCEQTTEVQRRW